MEPPLFRREAIYRPDVDGEIVLAGPLPYWALTIFFAMIFVAVATFLGSSNYTRKAVAVGVLTPAEGLIRVASMQQGLVTSLYVGEGRMVRTGDVLFLLSNERSAADGTTTELNVATSLRSRQHSMEVEKQQQVAQRRQRFDAARRRAEALRAEAQTVADQIGLQKQRVVLAESNRGRFAELRSTGFISPAQIHDKEGELLDQRQKLMDLERARAVIVRDLEAVAAEMGDLQIQAQRDAEAMNRSIAAISQEVAENEARREIAVRAPRDGILTAVLVEVGQRVASNQTLATIVPAGAALEAELHIPSRAAGFVRPGMPVLLRYAPFPYQKFGHASGRVYEVSSAPIQRAESSDAAYRVKVRLDKQSITAEGAEQALKPGTALEATISLDTSRLYEWLLEPLYGIKGQL